MCAVIHSEVSCVRSVMVCWAYLSGGRFIGWRTQGSQHEGKLANFETQGLFGGRGEGGRGGGILLNVFIFSFKKYCSVLLYSVLRKYVFLFNLNVFKHPGRSVGC